MKSLESYETESDSCMNNYQENDKKILKSEKRPLFSVSYILDEEINRSWLFFSNIILSHEATSNIISDYKFDKGNNTFKVGNEFSSNWIGISPIHYKVLESQNNFGIRKISWKITLDIGLSIIKIYTLYPITLDNKSLIKLDLKLINSDNFDIIHINETKDFYYNLHLSIIKKIGNLMKESSKNLFIQESCIVNYDLESCWKNMINLNLLSNITSGKIGNNFLCKGDKEKVGTFWKCYLKKSNKVVYFRVTKSCKSKKRNKWKYCLETIGSNLCTIPQELEINITKICKNTSQISILIKFNQNIDKELFQYKKKELNESLREIKTFLNNLKKSIYS
jgi:hypothetical protein